MSTDTRPAEIVLTASCGHTSIIALTIDPQQNATDIAAVMSNPCIPCAKAKKLQTRNITWADVNSRSR